MRARLALCLALLLAPALTAPAGAQDPIRVPPAPERAPDDALYVQRQFAYSMTAERVVYGQAVNSRGELQDLVLDVWEPEGHDEQFRPVIVWAPGGGFTQIGSSFYFMPFMLERGYVVVHVNGYRVRPELPHGFEEFLGPDGVQGVLAGPDAALDAQHDMQAAVRWVRANTGDLRVDPTRIVAGGYSAGGIMAWAVAYNHGDPGDSGMPGWPSHVAAALVGAGGYQPGVQGVITPGKPPVVAFHGTNDTTVPIALSAAPCAHTTATANVCEYHVYPGYTHTLAPRYPELAEESADFLYRHVIDVERTGSQLAGVEAAGHGGSAQVTGLLVTEDGDPLAGQRVLGRATAGWAETTTGPDGSFTLVVDAPDHGRATEVVLRYEGHSTGSWLDAPHVAPTHTTVTATWGGGPHGG